MFPEPEYHYIANGYYSWIRSPKNQPLQLDFLVYDQSKMLFAIEIEGAQHYEQAFYQTEAQHTYLKDCDILKGRTLRRMNIPLIIMKGHEDDWSKEDFIELLMKYGIQVKHCASVASK